MKHSQLTRPYLLLTLGVLVLLCLLFYVRGASMQHPGRVGAVKTLAAATKASPEKPILKEAQPVESSGNVHESELFVIPVLLAVLGLVFCWVTHTVQEPSQGYVNVFEFFRILPNGP